MDIEKLQVADNTIDISCDLLEITIRRIEDRLTEITALLAMSWVEYSRRAFVHEREELEPAAW